MKDYCKTCCHDDGDIGFCDKCFYNHILEEKGIPPTEYEAKPNPMTNADRIRAMSDEELAELFNSIQGDAYLVGFNARAESRYTPYGKDWLDWLRQEVADGS